MMTISMSAEVRTKVSSVLFEGIMYIIIQGKTKILKKVGKCSALEIDVHRLEWLKGTVPECVNYPSDPQH